MLDFVSVYKQEFPKIVACAISSGLQESDAKDLAQNALLDFYLKNKSGKVNATSHTGYIYQIVKWRTVDYQRKNSKSSKRDKNIDDFNTKNENELAEDSAEKDTAKYQWSVVNRAVKAVRSNFRPKRMDFFIDRVIHGKTTEEISKKYNVNFSKVYLSKHRVMQSVIDAAKEIVRKDRGV